MGTNGRTDLCRWHTHRALALSESEFRRNFTSLIITLWQFQMQTMVLELPMASIQIVYTRRSENCPLIEVLQRIGKQMPLSPLRRRRVAFIALIPSFPGCFA